MRAVDGQWIYENESKDMYSKDPNDLQHISLDSDILEFVKQSSVGSNPAQPNPNFDAWANDIFGAIDSAIDGIDDENEFSHL